MVGGREETLDHVQTTPRRLECDKDLHRSEQSEMVVAALFLVVILGVVCFVYVVTVVVVSSVCGLRMRSGSAVGARYM